MEKQSKRSKALSLAVTATLVASLNVPMLAWADEADGTQGEQSAQAAQTNAAGKVMIDEQSYASLQEAVNAVKENPTLDGATIKLTGDVTGGGVVAESGTNFTLDLGGFTYTVVNPTVGSAGTETNGFQLLKDSNIRFVNGTITASTTSAKILIQNYSNLTLENVKLVGTESTQYVMSNNNGNSVIGAGTSITAAEGQVAFDVCRYSSYESVNITVAEGAGKITGKIELFVSDGDPKGGASLTINGGDFSDAAISNGGSGEIVKVEKAPGVVPPAPEGGQWVGDKLVVAGKDKVAFVMGADGAVTQYASIGEAVKVAPAGSTVTLLSDVVEDVVVPANADVTIDLAGKKIANDKGHTVTVEKKAQLVVVDSVGGGAVDAVTHGKAALSVAEGAVVELNGGTFERSREAGTLEGNSANGNSYYTILNKGDLTINEGATVKLVLADGSPAGFSSVIDNGWFSGKPDTEGYNAKLTVNGGVIEGGKYVKNDSYGTMIVNGGVIKNGAAGSVLNWNDLTVAGGTFDPADTAPGAIFNVKGGEPEQGKTVVTGGTFVSTGDQAPIFTSDDANKSDDVAVSGGVFEGAAPEADYVVPGSGLQQNPDGSFGVKPAEIQFASDKVVDGVFTYDVKSGKAPALTENDLLALVKMNVLDASGYSIDIPDTKALADLNAAIAAADESKTFSFEFVALKDGAVDPAVAPLKVTVKLTDSTSTPLTPLTPSTPVDPDQPADKGDKGEAALAATGDDATAAAGAAVAVAGAAAAIAGIALARRREQQ